MAQVSFGTILREARERKGYDVQSAARRLRIRPDILRAIENNDFSRLPARGYTRNMVNAYARLVGLNPSDITRMYLDEAYAYQVGRTRGESESPAHVSGRRSVSHHEARQASARQREGQRASREGREAGSTRRMDRTQSTTTRRQRPGANNHEYREPLASRAARAESESRRGARVGGAVTTQFTNFYSGSPNMGRSGNQTRLPYVIVAAVILVLLVVIIALLFGNKGASTTQDVAKVPITGVTDTSADGSGTSDAQSSEPAQTQSSETVPTSVKVQYKLASGQTAYVVITQDGQATEQMLTGPFDDTVDVSGTWSLASWVSSGFTVTMDGKEVDFVTDAATGMPTATVNFQDYLTQWAADHPNVKVDNLNTSASSNAASSTNGSTASTTSTTGNAASTGATSSTATSTGSTTSTQSNTSAQTGTGASAAVNTSGSASGGTQTYSTNSTTTNSSY